MIKLFFAFTIAVFCTGMTHAQDRYLISGGGTHSSGTGGSVSWSIGEVVVQTVTSGSNHLTQGFHQGNIYVVGIEELEELSISLYPNPASELITVETEEYLIYMMYDMSGRLVDQNDLNPGINTIDVTSYSRGTYTISFIRNGTQAKNIKLIVL